MADPIIPNGLRVLAVQHKVSGLPEDVIVNSWAFLRDTAAEDRREQISLALSDFYESLGVFFRPSGLVLPQMDFRMYDLGQPPPREPDIWGNTIATNAGSSVQVEEAAVVLSFYAGRNLPRQRGRLYLGPWASNAAQVVEGNVRVVESLQNAIASAAQDLQSRLAGEGYRWCVLSGRDETMYPVTAGWVDNSFDTQRRRGPEPTARVTWTIDQPA